MSSDGMSVEPETTSPEELLDVLGHECSRRILSETKDQPMTAKQLSERCPVSTTTVYRHINALLDCGLLHQETAVRADRAGTKFYEPTFDFIEITLGDDGFQAEISTERSAVERFASLFDATRTNDVDVDVTDEELQLRVPLTAEFVSDMAAGPIPGESTRYNGDW